MTIDSVEALLSILLRTQVLTPPEVKEITRELGAHFTDPLQLANYLIEIEWLTEYQVGLLFNGRWDELTLGRYVALDRLGEGGGSEVVKAWDTLQGRTVALKILHQHLSDNTSAVREFHRELQAVAQLSHPNIIQMFDAHQEGPLHYFAMEYIDGLDLDHYVRRVGPLPIEHACEYIRQVAQGLQHAHQFGLVHRDIKPANLFLVNPPSSPASNGGAGEASILSRRGPESIVKILDWGLARVRGDVEGLVESADLNRDGEKGLLLGTADYIAPEQARDPCLVDIRADIYSLGCTLYFLLSGQPPFPGISLMQKLLQHQNAERPLVCRLRPDVPEELAVVVQRMMAQRPEERYAIPLLVAGALRHFVAGASGLPRSAQEVRRAKPSTDMIDLSARRPGSKGS